MTTNGRRQRPHRPKLETRADFVQTFVELEFSVIFCGPLPRFRQNLPQKISSKLPAGIVDTAAMAGTLTSPAVCHPEVDFSIEKKTTDSYERTVMYIWTGFLAVGRVIVQQSRRIRPKIERHPVECVYSTTIFT